MSNSSDQPRSTESVLIGHAFAAVFDKTILFRCRKRINLCIHSFISCNEKTWISFPHLAFSLSIIWMKCHYWLFPYDRRFSSGRRLFSTFLSLPFHYCLIDLFKSHLSVALSSSVFYHSLVPILTKSVNIISLLTSSFSLLPHPLRLLCKHEWSNERTVLLNICTRQKSNIRRSW